MLTREQLINGKHVGIHKNEQPLKGYKTVNCPKLIPTWFGQKVEYKKEMIELTIPVGAKIVRSKIYDENNWFDDGDYLINTSLRTDHAVVTNMTNFNCCSFYDPYFSYTLNKHVYPKNYFSENLNRHDEPGIHFDI